MTRDGSRPTLAVATANPGKIAEFKNLLGNAVDILSLKDLGMDAPEETGDTFEANAELKARALYERTGTVVLADDSGLEVDALGGAPGVRSARYAGDQHDDAENRRLLLANLRGVPAGDRSARFVAALAIIDRDGNLTIARETCEGRVIDEERGAGGFGYDPMFELSSGKTMAELSPDEKNAVSHRGKAVRAAMPVLRRALGLDDLDGTSPP